MSEFCNMSQQHFTPETYLFLLLFVQKKDTLSMESYRDLPPGRLPFLSLPSEVKNRIYHYCLQEKDIFRPSDKPCKHYGWTVSHELNFGFLRASKEIYREFSSIMYDTIYLALTISKAWAPEFANLDLRLPGTTNIKVCVINIAVNIPSVTSNPWSDVANGTARVILGVIKQLNRMPNLETVHVWHSGLVYSLEANFYYPSSLDRELRSFLLLKDYQGTTGYKDHYQAPIAHPLDDPLLSISLELSTNDGTRYGRAFTCHVRRP